jgi:hypothetical protein
MPGGKISDQRSAFVIFKNRHLVWLTYFVLLVGIGNLIINLNSILQGFHVAIVGIEHMELRLLIGGMVQSILDLILPVYLILGSLCELLLPKLVLSDATVVIRDQWFPKQRQWSWNELYGVEIIYKADKSVALEFRVAKFQKRKIFLSPEQMKDSVEFIVGKMPKEKLGKGFY